MIPNGGLQLVPLPIAQQVDLTQNEPVLFFCVGLALVGTILQLQLLRKRDKVLRIGSRSAIGFRVQHCKEETWENSDAEYLHQKRLLQDVMRD